MSTHENKTPNGTHQPSGHHTKTVLVLGGHGFVGRHTVKALLQHNVNVLIGTRGRIAQALQPNERQVILHQMLRTQDWKTTLKGVDTVINTVGILRERRCESFDAVHHYGASALAKTCQELAIPLIHMSALGIEDQSQNRYTKSKLRGEKAIIASGCAGAIVRTSVVNAPDGYGSGWLYRVARWPVWLVPAGAVHLLSPVDAGDAGEALAALALRSGDMQMERIEIGCGECFTLTAYLTRLRQSLNPRLPKPLLTIRVPQVLARFSAYVFDLLHITPYSIGHHELLEFDNIPTHNQLPELLGRAPTPISSCQPDSAMIKPGVLLTDS